MPLRDFMTVYSISFMMLVFPQNLTEFILRGTQSFGKAPSGVSNMT